MMGTAMGVARGGRGGGGTDPGYEYPVSALRWGKDRLPAPER